MGGIGKVPHFMFNDDPNGQLADDGTLDQTVPNLGSPVNTSPGSERIERFSRKVFVGGLPPDIDEGEFGNSECILDNNTVQLTLFIVNLLLTNSWL